jgi:NadR type nicotinamide-nucleotide adenylyltransferase
VNRIAITGPESTGKSWLAENLAKHFNTAWVPEYSREYLAGLGREYGFEDIVRIAKGQLKLEEDEARMADRFLFCDTDLLVTKVWSEFKYDACDPWILEQVKIHRYDLYLLCDIDLPWEFDPLREHPDRRKELFEIYRRHLREMKVNFSIVSGSGQKRLENAINAIDERLK